MPRPSRHICQLKDQQHFECSRYKTMAQTQATRLAHATEQGQAEVVVRRNSTCARLLCALQRMKVFANCSCALWFIAVRHASDGGRKWLQTPRRKMESNVDKRNTYSQTRLQRLCCNMGHFATKAARPTSKLNTTKCNHVLMSVGKDLPTHGETSTTSITTGYQSLQQYMTLLRWETKGMPPTLAVTLRQREL